MVNYKISVIGEVARPGTFTISNEKVNILEALAMAGDMTVYGLRDDVKLIRENANGKQEIIPLELFGNWIGRRFFIRRAEKFPISFSFSRA